MTNRPAAASDDRRNEPGKIDAAALQPSASEPPRARQARVTAGGRGPNQRDCEIGHHTVEWPHRRRGSDQEVDRKERRRAACTPRTVEYARLTMQLGVVCRWDSRDLASRRASRVARLTNLKTCALRNLTCKTGQARPAVTKASPRLTATVLGPQRSPTTTIGCPIMSTRYAVLVGVFALMAMARDAEAAPLCSDATLQGSYGFTAQGFTGLDRRFPYRCKVPSPASGRRSMTARAAWSSPRAPRSTVEPRRCCLSRARTG